LEKIEGGILQRKISVEFEGAVNRLVGQLCWGIIAGAGTGSIISLQLGRQIPRQLHSRNPTLSRLQKKYESEYTLFIECAWRLESNSKVICGCWDDNSKNGEMIAGLKRLTGSTVTSVNVKKPTWDLDLMFSNGLVLRVFCDSVNLADLNDNYSVFLPEGIFVVGTRSKLWKEQRESADNGRAMSPKKRGT
jgi:hypothetical protein